jgi:methylase of polypeptide subunit release factors
LDLSRINESPDDLFALSEMLLNQSQQEKFPYEIALLEQLFLVFANVFSPKHLPAADLFAGMLPLREGIHFLEIGTGIGAVAILAALAGASRVLATDINADAVANARANAEMHGLAGRMEVRYGDVFDPVGADERFDLIFWNVPFAFVEPERQLTPLQRSTLDPGYTSLRRYVSEGPCHLAPGGLLTMGFSSTLGRFNLLEEIAAESGLEVRIVESTDATEERPYVLELIHLLPRR